MSDYYRVFLNATNMSNGDRIYIEFDKAHQPIKYLELYSILWYKPGITASNFTNVETDFSEGIFEIYDLGTPYKAKSSSNFVILPVTDTPVGVFTVDFQMYTWSKNKSMKLYFPEGGLPAGVHIRILDQSGNVPGVNVDPASMLYITFRTRYKLNKEFI